MKVIPETRLVLTNLISAFLSIIITLFGYYEAAGRDTVITSIEHNTGITSIFQNIPVSAILVQILVYTSIPVSSRIFQYLQYQKILVIAKI